MPPYRDRAQEEAREAQEEQLDWLHQIAEESGLQTEILLDVRRHSGFVYFLAIVWTILTILGVIAWFLSR